MMLLEGVSKFGFGNWSVSRSGWDMDEMPVSLHWDNGKELKGKQYSSFDRMSLYETVSSACLLL